MLIGELAKASDTTKDTIRHYDQLGLLISAERQAGSRTYKDFSSENLERLEMIRLAKYMGFTLGEIAEQIAKYYAGGITHEEQVAMMVARLNDVRDRIKQMQEVEHYLELKIARLKNGGQIETQSCIALHQQVQQQTHNPIGLENVAPSKTVESV